MDKTTDVLLEKVIATCRCRSGIPLEEWTNLKKDIKDYLDGSEVDISEYQTRKIIRVPDTNPNNRLLISENCRIKQVNEKLAIENKKLNHQNKKLKQMFRGVRSLVKQFEKHVTIKD